MSQYNRHEIIQMIRSCCYYLWGQRDKGQVAYIHGYGFMGIMILRSSEDNLVQDVEYAHIQETTVIKK